jgi:regulator of replication initiation timing
MNSINIGDWDKIPELVEKHKYKTAWLLNRFGKLVYSGNRKDTNIITQLSDIHTWLSDPYVCTDSEYILGLSHAFYKTKNVVEDKIKIYTDRPELAETENMGLPANNSPKINELAIELGTLQAKYAYVHQQNELLGQQINELRKDISDLEEENDALTAQLNEKNKALEDAQPMAAVKDVIKDSLPTLIPVGLEMLMNFYNNNIKKPTPPPPTPPIGHTRPQVPEINLNGKYETTDN